LGFSGGCRGCVLPVVGYYNGWLVCTISGATLQLLEHHAYHSNCSFTAPRETVGPAKSATVGTLLIFGSCVTREVGAGGGSWRILRETPATLLGGDAARMTPEDFDKAVEARARDSTRKWQLDVLGLICAEHLLVSRFSLRSTMPWQRALSVHALTGGCCRSSTLRLRKRLPVSRGVAAECIHFDVGFALSHRECIVPTTCTSNPGGRVFSEHLGV
jgi:hypothetical protein